MTNRIVTGNFQISFNENEVKEIFSKYGVILFLKVLHKQLENVVVIEYSCEEGAKNAISDCKIILGSPCQLKFFEEFQSQIPNIQDIYSFDVVSKPFVTLVCEKIQESINLVKLHKIQLVENSLINFDNRSHSKDEITVKKEIKQIYGEKIYSIVKEYSPKEAGKITAMLLLALDETDLVKLIDDENLLRKQIEETFSWLNIKSENFQKVNLIPIKSPVCISNSINREHLLSKLDLCLRQLEFYTNLDEDVLKEKVNLCELLYPHVKQYGGSSIDRIMKRLMEMDNAMLKYLSTNKTALQNNVNNICRSIITQEVVSKVGPMSMYLKQNIINMDINIQNQLLELNRINIPYYGMNVWVDNYKKYLFNFMEHRLNAIDRINQLTDEIAKINNDFSQIIPSQQSGIDMAHCSTGRIEILPGQNLIRVPKVLPTSMPFLVPYSHPRLNDMIGSQLCIPFSGKVNQGDIVEMNRQTLENVIDNGIKRLDKDNFHENSSSEEEIEKNEIDSDLTEYKTPEESFKDSDQITQTNSTESLSFHGSSDKLDDDNISNSNDEFCDYSPDQQKGTFAQEKTKPSWYSDDSEIFLENLHPDVDEEFLYKLFHSYGEILSIRLMRNSETQKSLGVAYITFVLRSDAKTAMDKVNFKKIYRNECRIKWSESNKVIRKSEIGNVFIKNLDLSLNTKDIYEIFKRFGEIISCKLRTNEIGESLGFGFVRYDSEPTAELAIRKMNGKLIGNKVVYVGKFLSKQHRACVDEKSTNCYVKNLETSIDNEKLRELFAGFGEIVSSIVQVDSKGISKGRGFVAFKKHDEALRAITTMNGEIINDQRIEVSIAQHQMAKGNKNALNCNVYINRLDSIVDETMLLKEFSIFGTITSAKVMRDEENKFSLGYGFVCYSNPQEAQLAVTKMNGKNLEGKKIFVNICGKRMKVENYKSCSENNPSPKPWTENRQEPNVCPVEKPDFTKQIFGELLYKKVEKYAGNLSGKIVGMFLELDNRELTTLLEDENELIKKIQMAYKEINKFLHNPTKM